MEKFEALYLNVILPEKEGKKPVLEQCVDFFKSNKGFHRLLQLIKDKCESLGRIGGSVKLADLDTEEKEAFTGFFGRDYLKSQETRILLSEFQKAIDNSRFAGISIPKLLEGYFESPVIARKDRLIRYENVKNDFFIDIMLLYENTKAEEWLLDIFTQKGNAYITLLTGYNEAKMELGSTSIGGRYLLPKSGGEKSSPFSSKRCDENIACFAKNGSSNSLRCFNELEELLYNDLTAVCEALIELPFQVKEFRSMPVFAAEITKDPHAFDIETRMGKLLQYAVAWLFDRSIPSSPQERAELFYQAGLMIDDLSNQVLCCGFTAYVDEAEHTGWSGFRDKWQTVSMPLASISQTDKITAPGGRVIVVENPSIFSILTEKGREKETALVCTFGQPNLAVYVLLDMAVKNGSKLYYSGDMDPEGLLIADKLKSRYGEKLELICYSLDIYNNSISNVSLSSSRLKQMKNINNPLLRRIADAIAETGKAAYQEAFASHIGF